jgi:hypothetical protein
MEDCSNGNGVSKSDECSAYSEIEIKQMLSVAHNAFANAPLKIFAGKLCLPPHTDLRISNDSVTLKNPFCQLVFTVSNPAHMILNVDPLSRMFVDLGNGESRYEIRTMGIKAESIFFALRAQSRSHQQYEDWTNRLTDGVSDWFAPGNPQGRPQQLVP